MCGAQHPRPSPRRSGYPLWRQHGVGVGGCGQAARGDRPSRRATGTLSAEESFDDVFDYLFGELAADLFNRVLHDLLDDFSEDVVHVLNPF